MTKKKEDIIKQPPNAREVVLDVSFQHTIIRHTQAFGFGSVVVNIVEAYRSNARRYNKEANSLEQALKG